jgi:hypothetical protein
MKILFSIILLVTTISAQDSFRHAKIGSWIAVDQSIDSVVKWFGPPTRTDTLPGYEDMKTYFYSVGVICWVDTSSNKIVSFDIFSSDFISSSGLRLGDSVKKLKKLYGTGEDVVSEIRHLHPNYNYNFKDFTEIIYYPYGNGEDYFYHAMYLKNGKVVWIHTYRSLGC